MLRIILTVTLSCGLISCVVSDQSCPAPSEIKAQLVAISCYEKGLSCAPDGVVSHPQILSSVSFEKYRNCGKNLSLKQSEPLESGTEYIFRCQSLEVQSELRVTMFRKQVDGFGCSASVISFFPSNIEIPVGKATARSAYGG